VTLGTDITQDSSDPIVFDTALNDPLGIYNDNTGAFIIPQDGRYTVNATLIMTDYSVAPQSSTSLLLLIDDIPEAQSLQRVTAGTDIISYVLSIELGLTANQVLTFRVSVGGAAATATVLGRPISISSPQQTWATIRRVE
jgi:hypothetical protein